MTDVLGSGDVLREVRVERERQDVKWGEQNHPDGTGPAVQWLDGLGYPGAAHAITLAATATATTDARAADGLVSWLDIALEELAEAFAEDDPQRLRAELVQAAAVLVQWAQAIDRRTR